LNEAVEQKHSINVLEVNTHTLHSLGNI